MSQTIKCPNCKADLASHVTVCEWCNFVINQTGDSSIENISADVDDIIKSMKSIDQPTMFSSFKKNAKISMPIFAVAFLLLANKVSGWFALPGLFFLIYAVKSIFKKSVTQTIDLNVLKAQFDEKVSKFQNLYGVNNKYKAQIQGYQNEWKNIDNAAKKGKMAEWLSYSLLAVIIVLAFALPSPKNKKQITNELLSSENSVMFKADSLLSANNIDLAKKELLNIQSGQNSVELKSKIQLKEIEILIKKIENQIASGDLDNAKTELMKIKWIKNASEYDLEQFEESYFKQFIALKNAVNEKLPDDKKIEVENEFEY